MYPFKAVLVGCGNELLEQLQKELAEQGIEVAFDFQDARTAMLKLLAGVEKRLFIIQLSRPEDLASVELLADRFPGWPILAIMDAAQAAGSLVEAQRLGAAQIVALPLNGADFRLALQRIAKQFGALRHASELIVVAGCGEGSGATTVAMGLAYALIREQPGETILAELALRLGRLANNLDLQPNLTTPSLFNDLERMDPKALKHSLIPYAPNLLLLPGPFRTLAAPKVEPAQVAHLLQHLQMLAPFVVVDLPATLDDVYFAALGAATRVVLVAEHSVPSIQALAVVRDSIERHNISARQLLVLNRYDRKQAGMKAERLEEVVHGPHFHVVPSHYEALRTAVNAGKFVQEAAPDSPLTAAFQKLAQAILAPAEEAPAHKSESPLSKLLRILGS